MKLAGLLDGLQTEERNPRSRTIDTVSTLELCQIINDEDAGVAAAVRNCLSDIASAIDCLSERVRLGGRVLYVGAGTSGRLGVLDASEVPPTYSAPVGQFVGLIAGGDVALRSAREGAEDSIEAGIQDLEAVRIDGERDSLIGIASSGRTPYVLSCLEYAKSKGCATVGIACTSPSMMRQQGNADFMIEVLTGPEVVTGSTRMKAGTATKLILNMISTGIMIRLGKTFGNIMVDVKPTNLKLEHRARRILREIVGTNGSYSDDDLNQVLIRCDKSVRLAAVVLSLGITIEEAKLRLDNANGVLANLIETPSTTSTSEETEANTLEAAVCIDAGGSRCRASVLLSNGMHSIGEAGSCNVSEIGSKAAASTIKQAINQAINQAISSSPINSSPQHRILVLSVWVAIAGGTRRNIAEALKTDLQAFLPQARLIRVTNDIELLAAVEGKRTAASDIIVLVAGTGSIAVHYRRQDSLLALVARAGGWGPLLGDNGSGFDIGRQAIRFVLTSLGRQHSNNKAQEIDPLIPAIIDHFRPEDTSASDDYDLLSSVLLSDTTSLHPQSEAKLRIASCAKVVIHHAERSPAAKKIVRAAQLNLLELITTLVEGASLDTSRVALVLAGGVMQSPGFRELFHRLLQANGMTFQKAEVSRFITLDGARFLAKGLW